MPVQDGLFELLESLQFHEFLTSSILALFLAHKVDFDESMKFFIETLLAKLSEQRNANNPLNPLVKKLVALRALHRHLEDKYEQFLAASSQCSCPEIEPPLNCEAEDDQEEVAVGIIQRVQVDDVEMTEANQPEETVTDDNTNNEHVQVEPESMPNLRLIEESKDEAEVSKLDEQNLSTVDKDDDQVMAELPAEENKTEETEQPEMANSNSVENRDDDDETMSEIPSPSDTVPLAETCSVVPPSSTENSFLEPPTFIHDDSIAISTENQKIIVASNICQSIDGANSATNEEEIDDESEDEALKIVESQSEDVDVQMKKLFGSSESVDCLPLVK